MKISLYVYNGAASNAAFIQFKNNINLLRIVKPNCSSNFLVFHRYILWIWHQKPTLTRNSRPPSAPEIPLVPSLSATPPTFLVIRPSPDRSRSTCSNYFIVIKNQMWIHLLLSTNISKKTVISKLIALALLAVCLLQIRTFTELQTQDNQDSRQNRLDIVHEIFVKITLLSNSHSESFYLF